MRVSSAENSSTGRLALHLLRRLPEPVCRRSRLHLLDCIGFVAGAKGSELAGRLSAESPLTRAAWRDNLLEMDDVHRGAILHPGPVIWPTILRRCDITLDDALDCRRSGVRGHDRDRMHARCATPCPLAQHVDCLGIWRCCGFRQCAWERYRPADSGSRPGGLCRGRSLADAQQASHGQALAWNTCCGSRLRGGPLCMLWHYRTALHPRGTAGLLAARCERAGPAELRGGLKR